LKAGYVLKDPEIAKKLVPQLSNGESSKLRPQSAIEPPKVSAPTPQCQTPILQSNHILNIKYIFFYQNALIRAQPGTRLFNRAGMCTCHTLTYSLYQIRARRVVHENRSKLAHNRKRYHRVFRRRQSQQFTAAANTATNGIQ